MNLFLQKRKVVFFVALFIIVTGSLWFYLNYLHLQSVIIAPVLKIKHGLCLEENEVVEYERISQHSYLTQPKEASPVIYIRNKITNETMVSFRVENVRDSGHPIEIHKCGLYFIREFNYDSQKTKQEIGYHDELWKYDYQGGKKMLILLSEKPREFISYYGTEFSVASKETYVSLLHGYLGKNDYAIVIKDLKTLQDIFTLPIQEIEKRNPDLVQDISFYPGGWTNDGRYFWANTHDGANTLGFIRIDMQTKTFDLFPAPKDTLGGDALNIEKGLITVHPGNVWYGIAQVTEEEKAKRRAKGIGTELYTYNLFTKQKQLVASTTEPLYYFAPLWLSSNMLQYKLPSGATTTYVISQ